MNILMVCPRYEVTFWGLKHTLPVNSRKAAFPPLGLLTVAALLPRDWHVRVVDLNVTPLAAEDLATADCVMVSAMISQEQSTREVLDAARRLGKLTIAGGALFGLAPEIYAPLVDHLFLGEAEDTLPRFVKDLACGTASNVYRPSGYPDVRSTPLPRWDLVDVHDYGAMMIQASRGCPFDCQFCGVTATFGRALRQKSVRQVCDELNALYARNWRGDVLFVDDNFIGHRRQAMALLQAIIQWSADHGDPFDFSTQVPITLADDDETIALMTEAGFGSVFVGLETPDEQALIECAKRQNRGRDLVASVRKLQASGLQVLGSYIVGFDSDDETVFRRQVEFIRQSGVPNAMVNLLNALPNTRLWRRLEAEERLLPGCTTVDPHAAVNFVPRMGVDSLVQGYRATVKVLYEPREYYRRVRTFLDTYAPPRKTKIRRSDVKSFLKSIFYVGICGNGLTQWYYWRIVLACLLRHRKSFAQAVTLMVLGRHFHKVAQSM